MSLNILISRLAAQGDVLITSSIAHAFKKNYPGCKVFFETVFPHVLRKNPFIDNVFKPNEYDRSIAFDKVYNLNMSIESRPKQHSLLSITQDANVKLEDCLLFVEQEEFPLPSGKYIVFHLAVTGWPGRDWLFHRWQQVADFLMSHGFIIITIGSHTDNYIRNSIDLRNKTNINQLAYVVKNSSLYVGAESFPFHVAQAVNTPCVIFFGCVSPELRILRSNVKAVMSEYSVCLGCLHRVPPPVCRPISCEKGDINCETTVLTHRMISAITESLTSSGHLIKGEV